ncbi:MAG TPA: SDR family oxidoreductase [Pseudomonadales bacterium]|jgi:NAD(P)-dependent dehydrogenase (short-subunit alcohol dehydrogenase family)|nr:SDR family oxidoreductase [Pseudomonadales bacterium]MDP7315769.1 SDR family oxidoreductase [Pseudomonadales bacterium]HJL61027.1 SDR family oxidoreductase [Pseudomonadales bacterium]
MDLGLTGRVTLVTGSNRGTGFIIAKLLAKEGATVLVHSIEQGESEDPASEISGSIAVSGDITTDAGAQELTDQIKDKSLKVDILVNNYGTTSQGNWRSLNTDDWIDIYQKNSLSIMRMVKAFIPDMIESGYGRVVNLGTVGSTRPNKRMPHYYASKAALANMTVSLAKELATTGITVNLVSPGLIRTPEVEATYLERARKENWGDTWGEVEERIVNKYAPNPVGRIATREEVANVVIFLCSQAASFVNAQNIRVDGGALDII